MKKIIFVFLFASYLSLSNSLTLNVTKFDSFDQKNFTDRDGALCVNTSIISKGSSFYFIVESDGEGKIDSVIYYKSVDNCPPTNFEFNKEDNSFKKLEQKNNQKDLKYFTYQYEIPKEDDKIWYLVIYTGFEGKKLKASFLPFSALSFIIILLIIFVVLITVGVIICCCCCPCCKRKGKGTINSDSAFPEGETNNLLNN